MLNINNVSKTYSNSDTKAVEDLCLEVKKGEIFGFLGPNGAGKSTTIKMITGILSADAGTVQIGGHNIAEEPIVAKSIIGYVPDNHETYDTLKGYEYLNFMATMYGVNPKLVKDKIDVLSKMFDMTDALGNVISSYSHGMKQKIMIIGAILHDPDLWILDEPMTGLDPQSAFNLKKLMRQHADNGKTVFFSSHVIDVVEKVCDRIAIINHGKLVIVDTLDNIRANDKVSLEDIFLSVTAESIVE